MSEWAVGGGQWAVGGGQWGRPPVSAHATTEP